MVSGDRGSDHHVSSVDPTCPIHERSTRLTGPRLARTGIATGADGSPGDDTAGRTACHWRPRSDRRRWYEPRRRIRCRSHLIAIDRDGPSDLRCRWSRAEPVPVPDLVSPQIERRSLPAPDASSRCATRRNAVIAVLNDEHCPRSRFQRGAGGPTAYQTAPVRQRARRPNPLALAPRTQKRGSDQRPHVSPDVMRMMMRWISCPRRAGAVFRLRPPCGARCQPACPARP